MASTQELWKQNNSRLYWEKREQRQRELYMKEEAQQQKELERIYSEMYRWAEDEINRFYGKYADAEGIDITEAMKRVSQLDISEYEKLAKEYVKDRNFSDRANAEMRLYNATMKINRLEMLKARIGLHLVDGINTLDDYYEKVITDRTREEIERQAGILGETVSVADTTKRAENIVNASFFNATYSERIWSHQDRLRSMISVELQKGLIAGVGSRQMASNIRKEYDVSLADAHRLMVTELRRVQTDVAMDSYKASGVERYVYMAVNPRACPICRELDGKDYPVEGAEIANPDHPLPPMHPRCHCTTAPYVDEDDYNSWLNYLSQGGSTSDWNNMSLAERQKWLNPVVKSSNKWDRNAVQWSTAGKILQKRLNDNGVAYKEAQELNQTLTENEIITKLAGGDMTSGSCVSVALAYIANKCGLDVLDFRGGESRKIYSSFGWSAIARLNGINATREMTDTIRPSKALLNSMQEGKEYFYTTGRHASIVRLKDGKQEYLELQSGKTNGWKPFEGEHIILEGTPFETREKWNTSKTLQKRFGVTSTAGGEALIVDVEQFRDNDEFRDLIGYINTAEDEQKKGASGSVK